MYYRTVKLSSTFMRIPRFFQDIELRANTEITLDDNAAGHLRNVLRLPVAAKVIVFNGRGGEYAGEVSQISRQSVQINIQQLIERDVETPLKIHLGQAIAKGDRMDMVMQKAVELGVNEITPLFTERCNVQLDKARIQKKMRHWQGIIINACEQSGRNHVPVLHEPLPLNEWLQKTRADLSLVLDPCAKDAIDIHSIQPHSTRLLIGPEGGLSEAEVNQALQQQFKGLRLGPRILRTETAALAAISVLQCWWGDFAL